MVSKTVRVVNPGGLHARPVALFVQESGKFQSNITVKNLTTSSEAVDAKNIFMLMCLDITCGSDIEIAADGSDEAEALDALVAFVEAGCGD